MPIYKIFGLEVSSAFALPHTPAGSGPPEVEIREGGVPEALAQVVGRGALFEAGAGEALIQIPPVGRFHVEGGRRIAVEPAAGKSETDLAPFILNLCLALLLHQRGGLALHASVVDVGGRCVALAGHSGVGKSTLAAWLWTRGYRVLSDEICLLEVGADGRYHVRPGPPVFQLWRDVLTVLGLDAEGSAPTRPGGEKRFVPAPWGWAEAPLPLDTVYLLSQENSGEWRASPSFGIERFRGLTGAVLRREYVEPMGCKERQFPHLAALADSVEVMNLRTPSRFVRPEELEALLLGSHTGVLEPHP